MTRMRRVSLRTGDLNWEHMLYTKSPTSSVHFSLKGGPVYFSATALNVIQFIAL